LLLAVSVLPPVSPLEPTLPLELLTALPTTLPTELELMVGATDGELLSLSPASVGLALGPVLGLGVGADVVITSGVGPELGLVLGDEVTTPMAPVGPLEGLAVGVSELGPLSFTVGARDGASVTAPSLLVGVLLGTFVASTNVVGLELGAGVMTTTIASLGAEDGAAVGLMEGTDVAAAVPKILGADVGLKSLLLLLLLLDLPDLGDLGDLGDPFLAP